MRAARKSQMSSPKKSRASTAFVTSAQEVERERGQQAVLSEELHNAQMTISNQEIEIERLKTTVIALNAKCAIVDDHRIHADNTTQKHTESESMRVELHTHIKSMVEKVH